MKSLINVFMKNTILLICICALMVPVAFSQKVSIDAIVSKNLASIVSPDRKTKLVNITALGESIYVQGNNHQRPWTGKSAVVSDGKKLAIAMTFPLDNYPIDRINFDGKKLTVPYITPGVRSALGMYLVKNEEIVKEGLFGGVLSTGWTFHYPEEKKGSMSVQGTKEIDGRQAYIVSYSSKAGSGISIRLFFDVETGQHLRTEYRRVISAQMGPTPELSAKQNETIEELSEDFRDFKTENGVTLPRSYTLRLANVYGGNRREFLYSLKLSDLYYDQQLDAATFEIENK